MDSIKDSGQQEIIDQALDCMAELAGYKIDVDKINLAMFCKISGITRARTRKLKRDGFKVKPHGRCGHKAAVTVISGFGGFINSFLVKGVTNSEVIFRSLRAYGYTGSLTTLKGYISAHLDLVPQLLPVLRALKL